MAAVVSVDEVIQAPIVGRQPIGRVLRSNRKLSVGLVIFVTLAATTLIGGLFVEEADRRTGAFPRNEAPSFDSMAMILGTTSLGKRVVDHSFQLPLQIAWITTALVGVLIVYLFVGGHTPAPPVPVP